MAKSSTTEPANTAEELRLDEAREKAVPRQRIRELVRLSRLAAAHSEDELRDPTSTAHRQLVEIVHRLAR